MFQDLLLVLQDNCIIEDIIFSERNNANLKYLKLYCRFKNNVVVSITNHLKNLKYLSLQGPEKFKTQHLQLIFKNLSNLEKLSIKCCDACHEGWIADEQATISNLKKLRKVSFMLLSKCPEISFTNLSHLNNLESVNYRHCGKVIEIIKCVA